MKHNNLYTILAVIAAMIWLVDTLSRGWTIFSALMLVLLMLFSMGFGFYTTVKRTTASPTMKIIGKFILAGFLLLLALSYSTPAQAVQVGGNEVNFVAARYDYPLPGQSTWYYQIRTGISPSLGYIVFELNLSCLTMTGAGTWDGMDQNSLNNGGGNPTIANPDSRTNLTGVRFDKSFTKSNEERFYYFTVNDNVGYDPAIRVATKSGTLVSQNTITGPSLSCQPAQPAIDIRTTINGQDADEAPGFLLLEGSTYTLEYTVINIGNVPLGNVRVVDDILGEICVESSMNMGAELVCASSSIPVQVGEYAHVGTATGDFYNQMVSDTDPAYYTGGPPTPELKLEVLVNGEPSSASLSPPTVLEGTPVIYQYNIMNTGNVPVSDVSVTFAGLSQICLISEVIDPGQTAACESEPYPWKLGYHAKTWIASGNYDGQPVTASVKSYHTGIIEGPSIQIRVLIDLDLDFLYTDGDTFEYFHRLEGETVHIHYAVINTGSVDLNGHNVSDNIRGFVSSSTGRIPPGSWSIRGGHSYTVTPGLFTVVGTVTSVYDDVEIIDVDTNSVMGEAASPRIDVDVQYSGPINDDFEVLVGSEVDEAVTFTNTGNCPLNNIWVYANSHQWILRGSLQPGESSISNRPFRPSTVGYLSTSYFVTGGCFGRIASDSVQTGFTVISP